MLSTVSTTGTTAAGSTDESSALVPTSGSSSSAGPIPGGSIITSTLQSQTMAAESVPHNDETSWRGNLFTQNGLASNSVANSFRGTLSAIGSTIGNAVQWAGTEIGLLPGTLYYLPGTIGTTLNSGEAIDSEAGYVIGFANGVTSTLTCGAIDFGPGGSLYGHDDAHAGGRTLGFCVGYTEGVVGSFIGARGMYIYGKALANAGTLRMIGGGVATLTRDGQTVYGTLVTVGYAGGAAGLATAGLVSAGTGLGTVVTMSGVSDDSANNLEYPGETYSSINDAIGEHSIEGSTIVDSGATTNEKLIAMGYTKTVYVVDSKGVQWTVWVRPDGTCFGHPSTPFRGL